MTRHKPPSHGEKQEVALICGKGNSISLPVSANSGEGVLSYWQAPDLVVGSVSIDTEGIRNPYIKLDFSSMINYRAVNQYSGFFIGIIFQLSKAVNNGPRQPIGTYIYQKEVAFGINNAEVAPISVDLDISASAPFGFTWCECQECSGCLTYYVDIIDFHTDYIVNASITNVYLNALVVEKD